jgi:hypothetical protein
LPSHIFPNANNTGINASSSASDINRKHSSRSSRRSLQINTVNYSANNPSIGVKNKKSIQSPSQRAYLQSRYRSNQLFESQKSYDPCDILDIYLNNGDLVGVIKQQDPMGSNYRWFVDTGSTQGFVPSNILTPYHDDSWVTPPSDANTKPPKNPINSTPTLPTVQHQYKLHPAPAPPLPPRNDLEVHRYEDVREDSPPRYSKLNLSDNYENLLSFDESEDKCNGGQYNLGEFDPYAPNDRRSVSPNSSSPANHRYEEIPDSSPTPPLIHSAEPQQQQNGQQYEFYFAAYPFKATDKNQLSLDFGQPVCVRHKCDLDGNNEWWFVEDRDGSVGYVPASYLTKYQSK